MANLKIVSEVATADVKLESIKGQVRRVNGKPIVMKPDGAPKIQYKDPTGTNKVEYAEVDAMTGALLQGRSACYVDSTNGKQYQKAEVLPFYVVDEDKPDPELIPASKNEKTEVFEVKGWEPLTNYLDRYQMDSYYQVSPSPGASKKDFARLRSVESNTRELKKLWEYMRANQVVGRGTLNITSAGFLPSVGYLRAVELPNDKWTFEVAIFRETKTFTWSEDVTWKPSLNTIQPAQSIGSQPKGAEVEDI